MHHRRAFVLGITPQRVQRHKCVHRFLRAYAAHRVAEYLIHARQFKNHLTPRLEDATPLGKQVDCFPLVEVFENVNRRNCVCTVTRQFQLSQIALNVGFFVNVNAYPSVPLFAAASEVVGLCIAIFHASETVLGE